MQVIKDEGAFPIKMWTDHVPVEEAAIQQLKNVARLPFIHKHVAVMPDVHWGMGATVGSVIPTIGAIVPAAVGVDIGCGMYAVETTLKAKDLPDNLSSLRSEIERAVPHGFVTADGRYSRGSWDVTPNGVISRWGVLSEQFEALAKKHKRLLGRSPQTQLG